MLADSDRPWHPPSLVRETGYIRIKGFGSAFDEHSSDSMDAQAGLSLYYACISYCLLSLGAIASYFVTKNKQR